MKFIEDIIRFLETRLEEFLRAHPEIELQALDEQLRQQEADTLRLLQESRAQKQALSEALSELGEEIKTWHFRIEKAERANRPDLAEGARRREAELLEKGSRVFGQGKALEEKIQQLEALLPQIAQRRQEVKTKLQEVKAAQAQKAGEPDPQFNRWGSLFEEDKLEEEFRRLEMRLAVDKELDDMKKKAQEQQRR
ncbi:TIGR04376 family protein [Synechococcus sp. B60.1]|uniref:TIGR04376 family protein n=1 Tax=unclassified Synechococcus TaxID=2626047 RepID=UPI0039C4B231